TRTLQLGFPNATQPFTYSYKIIKSPITLAAVAGDFDGDRQADLAVFNKQNAQWTIQTSFNQFVTKFIFGAPNDRFVVGDFDGDLRDDLATYNPVNFNWTIRFSSDGSVHTQPFGTPKALPVPADYDGDGYTDIAIYDQ